MAIYGINGTPDMATYEYVTTDTNPVILYSNSISEPNFIDIYESKPGYWPKIRILDTDGNDQAPELRKSLGNQKLSSSGVGTAEVFMIDVFCILILLIGFVIARFFWTLQPHSK